jgi:pyruvyltransferase
MKPGILTYWCKVKNIGDTLTPILVEHFLNRPAEWKPEDFKGKLIGVGSIIFALRENDIVWGSGSMTDQPNPLPSGVKALALRGPKTRDLLGIKCDTFGDPALLLPRIYSPVVEKTIEVGYIPHYVDLDNPKLEGKYVINVRDDWQTFVNNLLKCKKVISTSLHGIIIAEAYGIPARWEVWSDKIIGGEFKFQDYFLGTGRAEQVPENDLPPIPNLEAIQDRLIKVLKDEYSE